jgi:hypothetical protein
MSTTYFRVERRPAWRAGVDGRWFAAATIIRADTDEPVQRLRVEATTDPDANRQLEAEILAARAALSPPDDWGRDPTVPRLVIRWLQLRDEVFGILQRSASEADAYDAREQAQLRQRVEALTEPQLLELVTPTTDQVAQIADLYVQDILTAKKDLSRFITRRSPAVQSGLDLLEAALNKEAPR